jgi:hypothetical protein
VPLSSSISIQTRFFACFVIGGDHGRWFHNPRVPAWYPDFCFAYDVAIAVFLGWRLRQLKSAPKGSAMPSTTSGRSV